MPAKKKHVDPLPESFASVQEAADFWDTHDSADYWDQTKAVEDMVFDIKRRTYVVPLDHALVARLDEVAAQTGLSGETLINQWIKEKLDSLASPRSPVRDRPAKQQRGKKSRKQLSAR